MYLANYGLSKEHTKIVKEKFKKWNVKNMSGSLTLDNLPSKATQVLSIHTDSVVSDHVLSQLPNLELIITRTTGYDHIDIAACKRNRVKVATCSGLNSISVAEFSFGLILSLLRHLPEAATEGKRLNFNPLHLAGHELYGKTLGIVGTGAIGYHVAEIAKGFGMNLVGTDARKNPKLAKQLGLKYMSLKQVFGRSDIVTLHVPATPLTEDMVNNQLLVHTKPGMYLINTARGSVVDPKAILRALESKRLAGYAADVLEHESLIQAKAPHLTQKQRQAIAGQKMLAKHPKVLFTPHIAHSTVESAERIFAHNIDLILKYEKGQKIPTIIQ